VAVLANRDEEVQKFRKEALGGRLLSSQEVPKWIEKQVKKEGRTLTISFDVPAETISFDVLAEEGWQKKNTGAD